MNGNAYLAPKPRFRRIRVPLRAARESWRESIQQKLDGSQFGIGAVVLNDSRMSLKRAVEEMGSNLYSELLFDARPYSADARDPAPDTTAFLWVEGTANGMEKAPVIGGCCFGLKHFEDAGTLYVLQWIWMHPDVRHQGMLTRAWPYFERRFGRFFVQHPLSDAMQDFLKTRTRFYDWLHDWGVRREED